MVDTAAATEATNGNGQKVTNAELRKDIQALTDSVNRLLTKFDAHLEQANARDIKIAELGKDIEATQDDVDGLTERVNTWSGVNSAGVILAGILAYFGINR